MSVIWRLTTHPVPEGRPSATCSADSHDEDEGSAGELVMVVEERRSSDSRTLGTLGTLGRSAEVMVFAVVGCLCEF